MCGYYLQTLHESSRKRCNVEAFSANEKRRRSYARYRFCFLHLCREPLLSAVRKRKGGRKKERKEGRKRKSRRSSPSSKAEEAFHAGLRIQSGRIIRSPFTGIYFFSLFSPPSPRFSSFFSRFVDRTIGSCAECCCLRIVLAEKFSLKNPQRRNRKNVRGKVMLRSNSVRTSYANFRDLCRSLSKTLREKPERTDRNAIHPFSKELGLHSLHVSLVAARLPFHLKLRNARVAFAKIRWTKIETRDTKDSFLTWGTSE